MLKKFLVILGAVVQLSGLMANGVAGDWAGDLDAGPAKMTLVFRIKTDDAGHLSGTMDLIEQGACGIIIDEVTCTGEKVKFELKDLRASFEGTLNKEGTEIAGLFKQGGAAFPLTLKVGVKEAAPLVRPQEPKPPYPYREEEVVYENSSAKVQLSGTLTLPKETKPCPVVLLIAGSGRHDRNLSVCGHKLFHVLADYLTRQGIGVLRVDKRGHGKSTGSYEQATTQDFANDVLAGVNYLKSRKDIDTKQIGLIGLSEGGVIAPMVAAESKDVAFVVLLAGPGVNGEEILYQQNALSGMGTEEDIARNRKLQEACFAIVKKEADVEKAEKQLKEEYAKFIAELPQEIRKAIEDVSPIAIKSLNTPWFRYFLTLDPSVALKKVRAPVLVLNGELDMQVAPKQNLPVIQKALQEGGNKDFRVIELPKLNHLFQTCETGAFTEYAKIEETFSPAAMELISNWIHEKAKAKSKH